MILLVTCLFVVGITQSMAQSERKYVRKGNKLFNVEKYTESEVEYLRALEADSTSLPAIFNIGGAMYKQNKYNEALERYNKIAQSKIPSPVLPATMYNSGNALFQMGKYQEAVDAYKMSLRMNPSDTTAKFNLAYALLKLQQQQQQQQNQDQNQDKNQDKQNQDQNQDKQNQDQNQDKQNQDQNQNQDKQQQQQQQNQDKKEEESGAEYKISKEQAEKMLEAIQANEDKTQEKVKDKDKKKGVIIRGSGKNW